MPNHRILNIQPGGSVMIISYAFLRLNSFNRLFQSCHALLFHHWQTVWFLNIIGLPSIFIKYTFSQHTFVNKTNGNVSNYTRRGNNVIIVNQIELFLFTRLKTHVKRVTLTFDPDRHTQKAMFSCQKSMFTKFDSSLHVLRVYKVEQQCERVTSTLDHWPWNAKGIMFTSFADRPTSRRSDRRRPRQADRQTVYKKQNGVMRKCYIYTRVVRKVRGHCQ